MSIYVDLDGTLAEYTDWQPGRVGKPIAPMLTRVKEWIAKGETVKIFTARAHDKNEVTAIATWLFENGLPDLDITNVKGFDGVEFWDDRAVHVEMNTGKVLG